MVKVISHAMRNGYYRKEFDPSGSKFFSLKRSSHYEKGHNWIEPLLDPVVSLWYAYFFIVLATSLYIHSKTWRPRWNTAYSFCILMVFPFSMWLSIVYFKGTQVEFSKAFGVSVPEGCFNLSIMLHFNSVFTFCQSSRFGVSSILR